MNRNPRLSRVEPFEPLLRVPRRRLIVRFVIAPFLWLVALLVVAVVLNRTRAIELGVVIAFASLLVSTVLLSLLRAGRNREQRRYGADS
jgi:hypothetical protein